MDLLSGDQNGALEFSVPGNSRAVDASKERNQSDGVVLPTPPAVKTIYRPSGDGA